MSNDASHISPLIWQYAKLMPPATEWKRRNCHAKNATWTTLGRRTRKIPLACPACGFLTIDEDCFGTYNICPIRAWEDDVVQLANPACGGGANGESLIDASCVGSQRNSPHCGLLQMERAGSRLAEHHPSAGKMPAKTEANLVDLTSVSQPLDRLGSTRSWS